MYFVLVNFVNNPQTRSNMGPVESDVNCTVSGTDPVKGLAVNSATGAVSVGPVPPPSSLPPPPPPPQLSNTIQNNNTNFFKIGYPLIG